MVAGASGMVGGALVRTLRAKGHSQVLVPTRRDVDLLDQAAVRSFFREQRPSHVFLAAARVGGIQANNVYRADFIYENIVIATNVIHAAFELGVAKLLNLGSSCIYPKLAAQPLKEEYLLGGELEPTNEPYAIAKIAAIKLCEAFRDQYDCNFVSVMPTNLFGPGDNFDLETAHVLPALIRRCHDAKVGGQSVLQVWGSGNPLREFLHVDDLAEACCFVMDAYDERQFLNIGFGEDITIRELAHLVADEVGFQGELVFDQTRSDGTPRKLLDSSRIRALGWKPRIGLRSGIKSTYRWYVDNLDQVHAQAN